MGLHEKLLNEAREERGAQQGIQARDEGIARADRGAREDWKDLARKAVKEAAIQRGAEGFTTDDVWLVLDNQGIERPREPRALGAVITKLSREGKIVPAPVKPRPSVRVKAHRNPKTVWVLAEGAA